MQSKRNKKRKSLIIVIIPIILIIAGIVIFIKNKETVNYDGNSLIGTFLYSENKTEYKFKDDGTGSMSSGDYTFDYNYTVNGNVLEIDFAKDEVHDVKYTFELNDGTLKLVSKEGTVSIGEEYILKKENK